MHNGFHTPPQILQYKQLKNDNCNKLWRNKYIVMIELAHPAT